MFTRFHKECIGGVNEYDYHGLVHRAGALFDERDFIDGENAIVDFKYSTSPRVTWWFDHHLSAFLTPEDQKDFERGQADGSQRMRKFYDPNYISCTSLITDIARHNFGFDTAPLAELIKWANIVDGAKYESAQAAVEMAAPAMKLTMVIESSTDDSLVKRLIPLLTEMPLQAVLDQEFVQELLGPLMQRHRAAIELIRSR
ncbi:MAG: phosphoesterase, partial [Edaphobacter sp.]